MDAILQFRRCVGTGWWLTGATVGSLRGGKTNLVSVNVLRQDVLIWDPSEISGSGVARMAAVFVLLLRLLLTFFLYNTGCRWHRIEIRHPSDAEVHFQHPGHQDRCRDQ